MQAEPALAMTKELGHLVIAYEVVLLVIQHGHEDIDAREELAKFARCA